MIRRILSVLQESDGSMTIVDPAKGGPFGDGWKCGCSLNDWR